VYDVTLTDRAPIGGTNGTIRVTAIHEKMCPEETRYVAGPTRSFSQAPEGWYNATVEAHGYFANTRLSSQDGASVNGSGTAPVNTPVTVFRISKWAGPIGACTASGFSNVQSWNEYTVPLNRQWSYCYKVDLDAQAGECLSNFNISDPTPIGGLRKKITGSLCPGKDMYLSGPARTYLLAPEGPFAASIEGYGMVSGTRFTGQTGAYSVKRG